MTRVGAAQRSGVRPATRNGFTLIELMVSAVIFLLILFAIYLVNETSHTTYTRGEVRTEIHQTARAAVDLMGRELRTAGYYCNPTCPGGTVHAIQEAQANGVKVFGDMEGTGSNIYVAYYVKDNDGTMVAGACPAGKVCTLYRRRYTTALQAEEELASSVEQLTFRYFDTTGTELAPGATGLDTAPLQWTNFPSALAPWTNRDAVRRFKVRLLVKGNPDKRIPNYELTTDITPRNLRG